MEKNFILSLSVEQRKTGDLECLQPIRQRISAELGDFFRFQSQTLT